MEGCPGWPRLVQVGSGGGEGALTGALIVGLLLLLPLLLRSDLAVLRLAARARRYTSDGPHSRIPSRNIPGCGRDRARPGAMIFLHSVLKVVMKTASAAAELCSAALSASQRQPARLQTGWRGVGAGLSRARGSLAARETGALGTNFIIECKAVVRSSMPV